MGSIFGIFHAVPAYVCMKCRLFCSFSALLFIMSNVLFIKSKPAFIQVRQNIPIFSMNQIGRAFTVQSLVIKHTVFPAAPTCSWRSMENEFSKRRFPTLSWLPIRSSLHDMMRQAVNGDSEPTETQKYSHVNGDSVKEDFDPKLYEAMMLRERWADDAAQRFKYEPTSGEIGVMIALASDDVSKLLNKIRTFVCIDRSEGDERNCRFALWKRKHFARQGQHNEPKLGQS